MSNLREKQIFLYICGKIKRKMEKEQPDRGISSKYMLKKPGATRTNLQREADVWWMVKQVANGRTYREVAEELSKTSPYKLDVSTICRDLESVLVEWKRENMSCIDGFIAQKLAEIEEIKAKVMRDYEHSKTLRPKEYAAMMRRGFTIDEVDELYTETDENGKLKRPLAGDPRYLEVYLRMIEKEMKLLGIDSGNDVAQQTIINYSFNNVDMSELADIADKLQDAMEVDEQ